MSLADHEPTQDPHYPRGNAAAHRQSDISSFPVIVSDPSGLHRQNRHEHDQKNHVDQREQYVGVGGAAQRQHQRGGDVLRRHQQPVLTRRRRHLEGDVVHQRRARDQPLRPDGHLDQDREEQQQPLVGGRQVHAPVEADQEDALDQEGGEDQRVRHPRAEAQHGAGEARGGGGVDGPQAGAGEQAEQQHLAEEEVAAAGGGAPGLAQHEHLEADDERHGDGGQGEHGDDPALVAEDAADALEGDGGVGGGGGGGARRHEEELGAHLQAGRGAAVQVAGPVLAVIGGPSERQACRDRGEHHDGSSHTRTATARRRGRALLFGSPASSH